MQAGQKRPRGETSTKETAAPKPEAAPQRKWPKQSHGNRRFGPDIVLKEDGYVIREDERPDHVIARDKARWREERGAVTDGKGGVFQECWICGATDHRRSDCPNKGFAGDDRHSVQRKLVCLGCRRKGHVLRDCPEKAGSSGGAGAFDLCYNCGSNEHSVHACKEPRIGDGFGFASCFVCGGKGHLSKSCPKNAAHGLYPRGGGCKKCGSTQHFVKDCDAGRTSHARGDGGGGGGGRDEDADDEEQQNHASSSSSSSSSSSVGHGSSSAASGARAASGHGDEEDVGGNLAFEGEDERAAKRAQSKQKDGKAFYKAHSLGKHRDGKGKR